MVWVIPGGGGRGAGEGGKKIGRGVGGGGKIEENKKRMG